MDIDFLMFPLGAALSYWPIYRILGYFWPSYKTAQRGQPPSSGVTSQQAFIDSLRQEAAKRALAAAQTSAAMLRRAPETGGAEPVDEDVLRQMEETRHMIKSLHSPNATLVFDRILAVCRKTGTRNTDDIDTLLKQLDEELLIWIRPGPSQREVGSDHKSESYASSLRLKSPRGGRQLQRLRTGHLS